MNPDIEKMARFRFGYGRWDAPYWFIGPEEGDAPRSTINKRVERWIALGRCELDDCCKFHATVEPKWHLPAPPLQPTWRRLIILQMAATNRSIEQDIIRDYQRAQWGMADGETCVIELSGLPAQSYVESKHQSKALFEAETHQEIRDRRIRTIRNRLEAHKPKLVVMYGCSELPHWKAIADCAFSKCTVGKLGQVAQRNATVFVFTKHPVAHGTTDWQWIDLGANLSSLIVSSESNLLAPKAR